MCYVICDMIYWPLSFRWFRFIAKLQMLRQVNLLNFVTLHYIPYLLAQFLDTHFTGNMWDCQNSGPKHWMALIVKNPPLLPYACVYTLNQTNSVKCGKITAMTFRILSPGKRWTEPWWISMFCNKNVYQPLNFSSRS